MMTRDEIARWVDSIIELGKTDDEAAHFQADQLMFRVITEWCPSHIAHEIIRLDKARFNRWCA